MILNKKVIVVMPAYNAEHTLEKTYREIPREIVDEVILVDDASKDKTRAAKARETKRPDGISARASRVVPRP